MEGLNPKNAKKGSPTRSVTKSGALQQISIPLVEALDLYDEGLAKDIKLRIKDMRKTVDGLMGTLKILRIIMGSVKVQASQTIAKGIEQNYSRLIDASKVKRQNLNNIVSNFDSLLFQNSDNKIFTRDNFRVVSKQNLPWKKGLWIWLSGFRLFW